MSGSRLGRGRGGRFAIYIGCGVVLVLLVFAYRAAVSEMARLRDLHEQCAHQHEALAAQLQVIFEYKVRLEKSLAEEKSSNAAVKQELQQRATREKTLRDKDGIEAMNRYDSLQQEKKKLETEHQDLIEQCDKRQKQASEENTKLENTLRELRSELEVAKSEHETKLEELKTTYLRVEKERMQIEEKYLDILKNTGDADSKVAHLQKRVIELTRQLEEAKQPHHLAGVEVRLEETGAGKPVPREPTLPSDTIQNGGAAAAGGHNDMNLARPPARQQSSSTQKVPKIQTPKTGEQDLVQPSSKTITQPSQKLPGEQSKVKLPVGVPPILTFFDAEEKPAANSAKEEGLDRQVVEETIDEKEKVAHGVDDNPDDRLPVPAPPGQRRPGEQGPGRPDPWAWQHRVKPGAQEVGDEPNNLGRLPGIDDGAMHNGVEGLDYNYDGGDYKEPGKSIHNDLRIEEGEVEGEDEGEAEGEDEGDPEYDMNNVKEDKRPE